MVGVMELLGISDGHIKILTVDFSDIKQSPETYLRSGMNICDRTFLLYRRIFVNDEGEYYLVLKNKTSGEYIQFIITDEIPTDGTLRLVLNIQYTSEVRYAPLVTLSFEEGKLSNTKVDNRYQNEILQENNRFERVNLVSKLLAIPPDQTNNWRVAYESFIARLKQDEVSLDHLKTILQSDTTYFAESLLEIILDDSASDNIFQTKNYLTDIGLIIMFRLITRYYYKTQNECVAAQLYAAEYEDHGKYQRLLERAERTKSLLEISLEYLEKITQHVEYNDTILADINDVLLGYGSAVDTPLEKFTPFDDVRGLAFNINSIRRNDKDTYTVDVELIGSRIDTIWSFRGPLNRVYALIYNEIRLPSEATISTKDFRTLPESLFLERLNRHHSETEGGSMFRVPIYFMIDPVRNTVSIDLQTIKSYPRIGDSLLGSLVTEICQHPTIEAINARSMILSFAGTPYTESVEDRFDVAS
jgi:hypothetical protein